MGQKRLGLGLEPFGGGEVQRSGPEGVPAIYIRTAAEKQLRYGLVPGQRRKMQRRVSIGRLGIDFRTVAEEEFSDHTFSFQGGKVQRGVAKTGPGVDQVRTVANDGFQSLDFTSLFVRGEWRFGFAGTAGDGGRLRDHDQLALQSD